MSEFMWTLLLCIIVGFASSFSTTRTIGSEQVSKAFEMCENNVGFDTAEITQGYTIVKCLNGAKFELKEGGE